jgi:hypothetical protein
MFLYFEYSVSKQAVSNKQRPGREDITNHEEWVAFL